MRKCGYEPPVTNEPKLEIGNSWRPSLQLAPNITGLAFKRGREIFIPLIISQDEGKGNVGRFLDSLSHRCVIWTVTSDVLRGMLERRHWRCTIVDGIDEWRSPISRHVHH